MIKKVMLLAVSAAALVAFAVPASASAAELTGVEVGDTVTLTSTNTVTTITATGGQLKCEHVEIFGVVAANSGGTVQIDMDEEGTDTASNCNLSGTPVAVSPTFEGLHLQGAGGTANFSFIWNPPGCTQTAVSSSVTWETSDSLHIVATINGPCGPQHLTGDFTLTDELGNAVIVH